MNSTYQNSNLDKGIGLSTGFLVGVIPLAEYNVPVILVIMGLIFGTKHIDMKSIKFAAPVIIYCLIQISLMIYHPGYLALDETLATVLATIALTAIPMTALIRAYVVKPEDVEASILTGVLTICIVFAFQYWILGGCRVSAFSVGPLGPPIILLPISMYVITRRALDDRFHLLDGATLILLLVSVGAFLGARMAFYSLTLLCIILLGMLITKRKVRTVISIIACICIGIYTAAKVDKCGDFSRMSNHLKMLETILPGALTNTLKKHPDVSYNENIANAYPGVWKENYFFEQTTSASVPISMASFSIPSSSAVYRLSEFTETKAKALFSDMSDAQAQSTTSQMVENFTSIDAGTGDRLKMWITALKHFISPKEVSAVLFGSGRIKEHELMAPHPHTHNQYLSWIVCGGILSLLSGIILFGPLTLGLFKSPEIFMFLSACALGFLTDSPLFIRDTTAQFLIMLVFVQIHWQRKNQN